MKHWSYLVAVASLSLFGMRAGAEDAKIVLIESDEAPKFDVLYHRAMTNAAGAAIGGLIGAGIQAGIESSKDGEKRAVLAPHVSASVWTDSYVKTLNEVLIAKGYEPRWISSKERPTDVKADIYIVLYPSVYGFRMVDMTTTALSAFVEFDAIYGREPPKSRKKGDKEAFYLTGQKQYTIEDLTRQTELVGPEVNAVLAAAARRLANKIIYNLK